MDRKKHSIASNLRFWIRYYLKNEPGIFWISILDILLQPCFFMLALYFPKVTLALIEEQAAPERLTLVLAVYTLLFLTAKGISRGMSAFNDMALNKERQNVVFKTFLKSLRIGYAYTESEEGRNDFRKAVEVQNRGSGSASSQFAFIIRGLAGTVLTFVLYSTVLGTLNIWMVFILLGLACMGYLLDIRENRFQNSLRHEEAVTEKHFFYMKTAMGNASAAKDIRIFGMRGWLRERMNKVTAAREKLERRRAVWIWKNGFLGRILNLVRDLGAYAYLIYMASAGDMTVSDFVLYFSAITGFSGFIREMASGLAGLQQASEDTEWVRGYLEMPEEDISIGSRHVSELARPISIEFRDVSFSYVSGESRQVSCTDGGEDAGHGLCPNQQSGMRDIEEKDSGGFKLEHRPFFRVRIRGQYPAKHFEPHRGRGGGISGAWRHGNVRSGRDMGHASGSRGRQRGNYGDRLSLHGAV